MARRIYENVFRIAEAPDPALYTLPSAAKPQPVALEESTGPSTSVVEEEEIVTQLPVQPGRAHQYFESTPDDFGAWPIFVRTSFRSIFTVPLLNVFQHIRSPRRV